MRSGRKKLYRAMAAVGFVIPFLNPFNPAAKANSITTTFANNNGQTGNFFDIITNNAPLTVTGMTVNTSGTEVIDIYDKIGTFNGSQGNPSAWTLVSQTPVFASSNQTSFAVTPFVLPANSTIGMYRHLCDIRD